MVYFDGIHLMADTLKELHTFAADCGLKREWFQDHKKHPHYDVWGGRNIRAVLRRGAKEVSSKDLVALSNKLNFVLSDVMGQLCPHCQSCEVDYIHDFTMEKECYKCGKSWA